MTVSNNQPNLFAEFETADKAAWLRQVANDLKGASAAQLDWETYDGIKLQPLYTADEVKNLGYLQSFHAQLEQRKSVKGWFIREYIRVQTENEADVAAQDALENGADEICFDLRRHTVTNFHELLKNIDWTNTPIFFQFDNLVSIEKFKAFVTDAYPDLSALRGGVCYDPAALWMTDAGFHKEHSRKNIWAETLKLYQFFENAPHFKVVTISGQVFADAGASAKQELAFSLASAVAYLDAHTEAKGQANIAELVQRMAFSVSVGTSYFLEIAKLRALRLLFDRVLDAYGCTTAGYRIDAQTGAYTLTTQDPDSNLLRHTTEAMAAIIGNCDSLQIWPHTQKLKAGDTAFAHRIARNIPLILRHEAFLDATTDMAAGSYYIDHLTHKLAQAAWDLFQQTEAQGGLIAAFGSGYVQAQINETRLAREQAYKAGQKTLVGTNKYTTTPNQTSTISAQLHEQQAENLLRPMPLEQI